MNIGIIGCGGIAHKHVEALKSIPNIRIQSVFDINRRNAEKLAETSKAKVANSISECIFSSEVVYILTPPLFHKEIAVEAIEAGKHVFIEKPISISLEDGEEIVVAAKQNSVKTMVGFNMRYRKAYRRLKEIKDSGELGEVMSIWSHRIGSLGSSQNWRTTPGLVCGMTIESLSHDIDIIQWIQGKPVNVQAQVFSSNPKLVENDDNASVIFTLEDRSMATIQASWSSHLGYNSRGIIGKNGTAMISGNNFWDFQQLRYKTLNSNGEVVKELNDQLNVESYYEENKHFIQCIKENRDPDTTVEYGLDVLKICHVILQSSKNNRVTSVY